VAHQCLSLAGGACVFDLALRVSVHVPADCLDEGHSFVWCHTFCLNGSDCHLDERQCHTRLDLPDVKVGHSFVVVLGNDVALVSVDDETSIVAPGVVRHWPDPLEDL
jgi:hypothetical protein